MRKTTTSLAIFCSAVVGVGVLSVSAGCGKRGDPLLPLRPFPAAAEGLTISEPEKNMGTMRAIHTQEVEQVSQLVLRLVTDADKAIRQRLKLTGTRFSKLRGEDNKPDKEEQATEQSSSN